MAIVAELHNLTWVQWNVVQGVNTKLVVGCFVFIHTEWSRVYFIYSCCVFELENKESASNHQVYIQKTEQVWNMPVSKKKKGIFYTLNKIQSTQALYIFNEYFFHLVWHSTT